MDTNKMRDLKVLAEAMPDLDWDSHFEGHEQTGFCTVYAKPLEVDGEVHEGPVFVERCSAGQAEFIAGAKGSILALLAQIERLKAGVDSDWAEVERIQSLYSEQLRKARALRIERDQIKTDNEAWRLTLEAERRIKRVTADEIVQFKAENEKMRSFLAEVSRTSGDKWAVMAARNLLKGIGHD